MKRSLFTFRSFCVGSLMAFLVAGCSVKRPDMVFQDAQMEDILYDYHIAKAMADEVPYNESYKKVLYVESVFQKHGITQAEFDTSMVWFSRHPDVLTKIYEQVKERLKKERDGINHLIALRDNKPKESKPGDSIDVWIGRRLYQLTGMPLDNKLTFKLPVDTNFKQRDTLRWAVRFSCLEVDSIFAPQMALQILYEKDTLSCGPVSIYSEGLHALTLSADTLGEMKEVQGFIYAPLRQSVQHILLDSITLMRYHASDTLRLDTNSVSPKLQEEKVEKKKSDVKPMQKTEPVRRAVRPRPVLKKE